MKIKFKVNETKQFLLNEKKAAEENMAKLGPGEEWNEWYSVWERCNNELKEMSLGYKITKALPVVGLCVTAVGTIGVPLYLGTLAWKKSEDGELKEGDSWRIGVGNIPKPKN